MRGAALTLGTVACFVGCGLSLAPTGNGPTPPTDGSVEVDGFVPPPPDGTAPDTFVPPTPLTFKGEQPSLEGTVVAMAEDETSGTTAVLMAEGGGYAAHSLGEAPVLFSFIPTGQPSSFAPLPRVTPAAPTSPTALFTLGAGLFVALEDTTAEPYGDNATIVRVVRRGKEVFVGTSTPGGGTRIHMCPASGDAGTAPTCTSGLLVYDTLELGGFTLSKSLLRLVGLTGSGTSLRLETSTRATAAGAFITPVAVPVAPDALGEAEEVVSVSDDGGKVTVRAKCRNTADRTCLVTLSR